MIIYSRLSRCSTARGSISGLSRGDPTKVKAHKSFLFTEGSLKVESNKGLRMSVLVKAVTKMVTECLRTVNF